ATTVPATRHVATIRWRCLCRFIDSDPSIMEPTVRWDLVAEGLTHEWVDVGRVRMHARVSTHRLPSDAPAVVLVHGIGVSGRYLVPTAVRLATTCRVYVPDLPGFGLSTKPSAILDVPALA